MTAKCSETFEKVPDFELVRAKPTYRYSEIPGQLYRLAVWEHGYCVGWMHTDLVPMAVLKDLDCVSDDLAGF